MKTQGSNGNDESLSKEQKEEVLRIINEYAERTNCASEAMGVQLWLHDNFKKSNDLLGSKNLAINVVEKMNGPLKTTYCSEDVSADVLYEALESLKYHCPNDYPDDGTIYKDRSIKSLPRITYTFGLLEKEILPDQLSDFSPAAALSANKEFETGVARLFKNNEYAQDTDLIDDVKQPVVPNQDAQNTEFSDSNIFIDIDNETNDIRAEDLIITFNQTDLDSFDNAYQVDWPADAVRAKRKLRLTALHEIVHILLREGCDYLGLPHLKKEDEDTVIDEELAPILLDKKSQRFSDFAKSERSFKESIRNASN